MNSSERPRSIIDAIEKIAAEPGHFEPMDGAKWIKKSYALAWSTDEAA